MKIMKKSGWYWAILIRIMMTSLFTKNRTIMGNYLVGRRLTLMRLLHTKLTYRLSPTLMLIGIYRQGLLEKEK